MHARVLDYSRLLAFTTVQKLPYGQPEATLTIEYVRRVQVADFHQSRQEDLLLILILNLAGA